MVHLERNQRVVLCRDNQRRHADGFEKSRGRLSSIVVRGSAKAKQRSREPVVELPDGLDLIEAVALNKDEARSDSTASPGIAGGRESAGVKDIRRLVDGTDGLFKFDRRGDRYHASNQVRLAQFTGQFERHVPAQ